MDFYKETVPILEDSSQCRDVLNPQDAVKGYVERDYAVYPQEMFAQPDQMNLIPASEYDARYDEQEQQQSSLEHIYLANGGQPIFTNLDQNGNGYCWSYSNGHCIMMVRAANNQPLIRLNPHATAAIIKGGRDEGGWCGLSAKFGREFGYAVEGNEPGQWPKHSRDLRYDTAVLRENMSKHKILEDWVDMTKQIYDQNLTKNQLATALFNNQPCAVDFNFWSHSVCGIRWVRLEAGSWGLLILNSWLGWGRFGLAVLRGSQSIPDGAVCLRTTGASVS